MSHCHGCGVQFPSDGGSGVFGYCLICRECLSWTDPRSPQFLANPDDESNRWKLVRPPWWRSLGRWLWEAAGK